MNPPIKHLGMSLILVVLVAVPMIFAGCGASTTSSGSSTSTTPTSSSSTASTSTPMPTAHSQPTTLADYCKLVTLAEVSQITGLTITQVTPVPNQARQEVICGYVASAAASTGAVIIFLVPPSAAQAQTIYTALKQQAQSKGATVGGLSGIGDQAFSTQQSGANGVVVLKGSVAYLVSGTTPHPLPLAMCKQLAQLVASRL
jgi:hypothetical protein